MHLKRRRDQSLLSMIVTECAVASAFVSVTEARDTTKMVAVLTIPGERSLMSITSDTYF